MPRVGPGKLLEQVKYSLAETFLIGRARTLTTSTPQGTHMYRSARTLPISHHITMTLYPPLPQSCPSAFSGHHSAIGVGSPKYSESKSDQRFHFAPCGMELYENTISPIYRRPHPSQQFDSFGNSRADEHKDWETPSSYKEVRANYNNSSGGMVSLS